MAREASPPNARPRTLFDKIWERHTVATEPDGTAVIYVDLHLVHDVTSPQAFAGLRARGLRVRRPDRTLALVDHAVPTQDRARPLRDGAAEHLIARLETNCRDFGVPFHGLDSPAQGIVHVVAPELGLTQPGMTVVCGDSHTSTHGAFGAWAFGIGTSEVEQVLATQCLRQAKPRLMEVRVEGRLGAAVTAKDLILALVQLVGVGGAAGHVIEYAGSAIARLTMEQRMTLCNMSIEAGARAGLVAPDEVTLAYLRDRPNKPTDLEAARASWADLHTDSGAPFDRRATFDATDLEPMITYGTNPAMVIPVSGCIPTPGEFIHPEARSQFEKALAYMNLEPGRPLLGHPVDVVFIGSCTNGRLSDLRQAAAILKRGRAPSRTRLLIVPGSQAVRRAAEREGLHQVFESAGAEWREAGCSMCIAMNGDRLHPGAYAVSTSNRNFEGRQGPGGRTFLASPLTAAASALEGRVADPRAYVEEGSG